MEQQFMILFFIDWESLWQRRPQITEDYNHF